MFMMYYVTLCTVSNQNTGKYFTSLCDKMQPANHKESSCNLSVQTNTVLKGKVCQPLNDIF